ncbi:MAG: hypothetical protein LBV04_06440 [Deferribacteraceae bacterium]|jgi:hypothetical protein|nr:hypothetical protein [Deferribacteraceae bacterium]
MNIKILTILIILAFAAFSYSAEPVIATGYGVDEQSSLDSALVSAIEQVLGAHVRSELIIENKQLLDETITSKTAGYVKNYNVLAVRRENGSVRTVIEADVDTQRLLTALQSMNIALLEVDSEQAYSGVMVNAARIEDTRKYIASQWPQLLHLSNYIKFTIDNIYFDEAQLVNNRMPFVVRFRIEADYAAYDKAMRQLTDDIAHFMIAENTGVAGTYAPEKSRFSVGSAMAVENVQTILNQDYTKKNDLQIALRLGQRYVLQAYKLDLAYREEISKILADNKAQFMIRFRDAAGKLIYENTFSLFPVKDKISAFFNDKDGKMAGAWVDNKELSLKSFGLTASKVTPYIHIEAGSKQLAMDKLMLGYQDSISLELIRSVNTITIEKMQ